MKWAGWQTTAAMCLVTACSRFGNDGRPSLPADLATSVPWANGVVPPVDAQHHLIVPNEPIYPPIASGMTDPGSRAVDCSALSEIELSPFWTETFEPDPSRPNDVGIAQSWSSYDDGTWGALRVPGDASWHPGLVAPDKRYTEAWGLAADEIAQGPSCDGQPNNWALHFRGGRFNYFGAGAEHPLAEPFCAAASRTCDGNALREVLHEACPAGSDLCPPVPDPQAATDRVGLPLQRSDGSEFQPLAPHLYWDLGRYDGITFWARRGPESQPGILIALQDKHTSDALNREHQTFCRRIKTCRIDCQNRLPCENENPLAPEATYRCFDPALGMPDAVIANGGTPQFFEPALKEEVFPVCGASACRSPSYFGDSDFDGSACRVFEFSGSQAGTYCYGSVPPPPDEERCGDGWVAPVHLSTEWQLYAIPFSEFRQVGFGKRAPFFELHAIYMMAFQFPVGFADVYIDNVSFYRRRR